MYSLPFMISPDDSIVRRSKTNPSFVMPLSYRNLKFLSFGHVNPKAGVAGAVLLPYIDDTFFILLTLFGESRVEKELRCYVDLLHLE
jgi:hypothetical protein